MAIEIISTTRQADDRYTITIRDTADVTGKDELGTDTYRTYSLNYNPYNGKESLVEAFKAKITETKALEATQEVVKADIKTVIEAIDTTKLEAK